MSIQAGDVFAFQVNSHRSLWNGRICADPANWNCGAPLDFRTRECAQGSIACHHLNIFSSNQIGFITPDPGVMKLLAEHQSLLDNQLVFFFGQIFDLNRGGRQDHRGQAYFGAYRVKSAKLRSINHTGGSHLFVEPHPDGWALFPPNLLRREAIAMPPAQEGISYLRQMDGQNAQRLIDKARELAQSPDCELTQEQRERLKQFSDAFPRWRKEAELALKDHALTQPRVYESPSNAPVDNPIAAKLKNLLGDIQTRQVAADEILPSQDETASSQDQAGSDEAETVMPPEEAMAPARSILPESGGGAWLNRQYGAGLVNALRIGSLSKSLLILTGPPGVGKSRIAGQLIDDPDRERSAMVAVSSTWRGREDLLGYVNPVDGEFEPTAFTRFLLRAERAWDAGDRRPWLVVFEEFNLSQPEHWLSDLLVRLEYEPERRHDRTIMLGGKRVAGEPEQREPQVFLPPSLMLVATLNNDHTGRPLSPRVLDRGALIEVSATGRAALEQVAGEWPAEVTELVGQLNDMLELRGVSFSVRSAQSLQRAAQHLGAGQMLTVLDHVLVQEVLSKVRLMAGDPRDEKLLQELLDWSQGEPCAGLALSRQRIAGWSRALEAGRDVFQA